MNLVLFRIDDRLLHAQVVVGWGNALSPDVFFIADDQTAVTPGAGELLRMGLPSEAKLMVAEVKRSPGILKEHSASAGKCVLLVRGPKQALELVDGGVSVGSINVGGMHFSQGKRKILPYLYVNDEDILMLRRLAARVPRLTAQDVPGNPCYDVAKLLGKVDIEQD
ncbi:MAG: PTS sugar transporter subunit IIB [Candidatus Eisenbacteria bacterium]